MEKQISIIIPTYNMEKYIGRCLDSLIIPEFDQVEVLVVNDGSKDRSSEIAHEYADRYPESIKVIDKENGNYGSCINAGLPVAIGRYVKILDADDYFTPSEFSKLVRSLRKINADAVITTYQSVDEDGNTILYHDLKKWRIKTDAEYSGKSFLKIMRPTYFQMHQIAYNRDIFSKIDYTQLEGISYTDMQWAIEPMSACTSIVFKEIPLYNYLVGREGQTMAVFQTPKALNTMLQIMQRITVNYHSIDSQPRKCILGNLLTSRYASIYRWGYDMNSEEGIEVIKQYDHWLNNTHPEVYELLNDANLEDNTPYKFIKHLRKSGYNRNLKLSLTQRLLISLDTRLKALMKGV